MKVYAVKKGRKTGIFYEWDECKRQVAGYSDAKYKSFENEEDAHEYLSATNIDNEKTEVEAYVDGSFDERMGKYAYGCVIISEDEIVKTISGCSASDEYIEMKNVAGELESTIEAINWCIDNGYKSVKIYHDYEGIASWALGEWKANKIGTKKYVEYIEQAQNKIAIYFSKVKGHNGDKYNEMADKLAREGLFKNLEIDCTSIFEEYVKMKGTRVAKVIYNMKGLIVSEKDIVNFCKFMIKKNGYKRFSDLSVQVLTDDKKIVVTFVADDVEIEECYKIMN